MASNPFFTVVVCRPHNINIWHQILPHFPPPQPPSSSDPEDTPNLLDEIGGSTSILPVFSTGLISLLLTQKWPSFAVFLSLLTVYLAKGLTTG